jgi:hypothetical protein
MRTHIRNLSRTIHSCQRFNALDNKVFGLMTIGPALLFLTYGTIKYEMSQTYQLKK